MSFKKCMWCCWVLSAFASFSLMADTLDSPREQTDLVSFREMSPSEYNEVLSKYKDKGYRPIDVEILGDSSERTYALVMRKNTDGRAWAIHTKLTSDQFNERWQDYRERGFRLIDQESYTKGRFRKTQYYAGIWVQNRENYDWASNRNMTSSRYSERLRDYRDQRNLMPIDVDAYEINGSIYWSGVWVENKDNLQWSVRRNIALSDFGDHFQEFRNRGYRLLDTNSYMKGGNQYFATIWVNDRRNGNPRWLARRNMTERSFYNWNNRFTDRGYRLEDLEVYETGSGVRYAGVWVEDKSARLDWPNRSSTIREVNNWLRDEENFAVGMSVAVVHEGEFKFVQGFGKQNKQQNADAHGGTIYRTASIAKAISGTLGFLLQDRGFLDLDAHIRTLVPSLPTKHDYTVGDTLTNRSMVRHYFDSDDDQSEPSQFGQTQFNRARPAVDLFQNDDLESGRYNYSTHAYTIFAAAAERATRLSFCNMINLSISRPHNLPTMGCENQASSNFENFDRAQIYNTSGNPVSRDNLSWKYAGGGMESSVVDLARFGKLLNAGKILSEDDVRTMTRRPDNARNYGYGWDHGYDSDARASWYGKGGRQRGSRSYIRVYPDHDLVIAVMINNRNGDGFRDLTSEIAQNVLGR